MLCYSTHSPIGAFQLPITSSITIYYNNFTTIEILLPYIRVYPNPLSVNFPVGRNWSARRKPTTFGRVLTRGRLHEPGLIFNPGQCATGGYFFILFTWTRVEGESSGGNCPPPPPLVELPICRKFSFYRKFGDT